MTLARRSCGLFLAAGLVAGFLTPVSPANQLPDLSGSWSAVADPPPGVAAAPSPVLGPRFDLRLDGNALAVARPARGEIVTALFELDGSRTRVRVPGRICEGDAAFFETATWEDGALALTVVGAVPAGGGPVRELRAKRLLRLQDPDTLVVAGTMAREGEALAVATVYRRSDPLPAPAPEIAASRAPATIAEVAWIQGEWTGASGDLTVEEHWTTAASGAILGVGRSLRNHLMVGYEFLCIAERDGGLVYTAMPDGRTTPTHFALTAITEDEAVFENPAHDYPKMIRYRRLAGDTLETTIADAGGERAQSFVLKHRN